jgi:hypothetical protein
MQMSQAELQRRIEVVAEDLISDIRERQRFAVVLAQALWPSVHAAARSTHELEALRKFIETKHPDFARRIKLEMSGTADSW